ncbi:MAG: flagellar hook-basal body complex protein FliE [Spirochaetaceae bacterium]|nr:flagellar hook-basal body complex protein FliE [Spirochaetaceae bacterium]MBO4705477.1 flagellar hook-basal body complex protein FliE [Spirochaetaceae bacterium]
MGNSPLVSATEVATGLTKDSRAENEKKTGKTSFADYLMEAANYVNEKQQTSSDMAEKLVLDPDSVDVHDVTIAMAEANLSLSIAQNVIERLTKAWSEITTTR